MILRLLHVKGILSDHFLISIRIRALSNKSLKFLLVNTRILQIVHFAIVTISTLTVNNPLLRLSIILFTLMISTHEKPHLLGKSLSEQ